MKKLSLTVGLLFAFFISNAQIVKGLNTKMEVVKYELSALRVTDSLFMSSIDATIIPLIKIDGSCKTNDLYLLMDFSKMDNSVFVIVEQSKYPGRKRNDTAGYFNYEGYTFIVSGNAGQSLFDVTTKKRMFTYKDYIQPSVMMLEDDTPSWSFRFQNGQLYPNNAVVD